MEMLGANASTLHSVTEAMPKPGFGRGSFIAEANFVKRQGAQLICIRTHLLNADAVCGGALDNMIHTMRAQLTPATTRTEENVLRLQNAVAQQSSLSSSISVPLPANTSLVANWSSQSPSINQEKITAALNLVASINTECPVVLKSTYKAKRGSEGGDDTESLHLKEQARSLNQRNKDCYQDIMSVIFYGENPNSGSLIVAMVVPVSDELEKKITLVNSAIRFYNSRKRSANDATDEASSKSPKILTPFSTTFAGIDSDLNLDD